MNTINYKLSVNDTLHRISITTVGTIGTGVWSGTVIDKTYLDDEVYNTSLNSYTIKRY